MADINVDVNLPSAIDVDITSPTQALVANVSIAGPTGPQGATGPSGVVNTGLFDLRYYSITNPSGFITGVDLINYVTKSGGSFIDRPTVNGTGVLLSGEIPNLPTTIVYTTGDQTISGNKSFAQDTTFGDSTQGNFLVISGNQFTVYGSGNFTSGLFINNSRVALKNDGILTKGGFESFEVNNDGLQGYFTAKTTNRSDGNIGIVTYEDDQNTVNGYSLLGIRNGDGFLQSKSSNFRIETFGGGLGNLNAAGATFTSVPTVNGNPVLTGVNLSSYATITNLASTGSTLNSNINSLSGTLTSNYSTITNLASTGSTLDTKINNLSGYINSSSSNIVFTTGDQTISGIKTFIGNHIISGNTTITGNLDVSGMIRTPQQNKKFVYSAAITGGGNNTATIAYGANCTLTPRYVGTLRADACISMWGINGASTDTAQATSFWYGTGTAPVYSGNLVNLGGTRIGGLKHLQSTSTAISSIFPVGTSWVAEITGLNTGTQYWFDIGISGSNARLRVQDVQLYIEEKY